MDYDESLYENEEDFCPLCCEELDITDRNFKPCPCGYQICQFCYNNIRTNPELNGKCPACRRLYDDESVVYIKMSTEEIKQYQQRQEKKKREKKELEKQKREQEIAKRHHLANMRVIQKNLVYVLGLNPNVPYDELPQVLRSDKYFGKFGKINKVVINRRAQTPGASAAPSNTGYSVYVTFAKKEDASRCIDQLDGAILDDRILKAAHGTTKYCSSYLRGQQCQNPNCMFLHEPGEEAESYNRDHNRKHYNLEESQSPIVQHSALNSAVTSASIGAVPHTASVAPGSAVSAASPGLESIDITSAPALPSTVSWANNVGNNNSSSNLVSANAESSFPTLSAFLQQQQQQNPVSLAMNSNMSNSNLSTTAASSLSQKRKKDSDKKQILDETMAAFKSLSETLQELNTPNERPNYKINPRFDITPQFNLFHPLKLDSFEDKTIGFMTHDDSKLHLYKLVDTLLFTPSAKNYNYRACLEARQQAQQAQQIQQQQQQQVQQQVQHQQQQVQQPQVQQAPNRLNTAAFLQQRLQQQQMKQQQTSEVAKHNTQELLSQLMK